MRERLLAWWGLRATRRVTVSGVPIRVPPGVLDPVLFRSGAWFAAAMSERVGPGERVLDLGCGSGVVGVLAARRGARVTAVDVDPAACAAARANGLSDVREGDLFAPVQGERFDHVCFNPPYLPGDPASGGLGRALYGGADLGVVARFVAQVPDHIAPGGAAWVVWSDRAPAARAALDPAWREVATRQERGERLSLWTRSGAAQARRARGPGGL